MAHPRRLWRCFRRSWDKSFLNGELKSLSSSLEASEQVGIWAEGSCNVHPGRDAKGPLFCSNWTPQKSTSQEGWDGWGSFKNREASAKFFHIWLWPCILPQRNYVTYFVMFWCHVFFKHHLLPSEEYDLPLFYLLLAPKRDGHSLLSSPLLSLNFWILGRWLPLWLNA